MPKWFERAFGAVAQEVSTGLADIREKLVFEFFFGRKTPETQRDNDLGWSRDDHPDSFDRLYPTHPELFSSEPGWRQGHPGDPERGKGSALDHFYDRLSPAERAEHFCQPPAQDRGIER